MALEPSDWERLDKSFEGIKQSVEVIRTENNIAHKDIYKSLNNTNTRVTRIEVMQEACKELPVKIAEHDSAIITIKNTMKECAERRKENRSYLFQIILRWGPAIIAFIISLAILLKTANAF